jgi:hypothetical protein
MDSQHGDLGVLVSLLCVIVTNAGLTNLHVCQVVQGTHWALVLEHA